MSFRATLIRLVTFLGGIYFVFYFLAPESILSAIGITQAHEYISYGFVLVGAVAFGVGIINLFLVHGSAILKVRKGWGYSVALLVGLLSMMTLASLDWVKELQIASVRKEFSMLQAFSERIASDFNNQAQGVLPLQERQAVLHSSIEGLIEKQRMFLEQSCPEALLTACAEAKAAMTQAQTDLLPLFDKPDVSGNQEIGALLQRMDLLLAPLYSKIKEQTFSVRLFSLLNEGFFVALGSSMFALLAFYITSAAFRAFRVKNMESALLLLAAVVVMLGQIPFGVKLWAGFPEVRLWLLQWPNSAAFRAISIGASVAMFVMSIRLWLSLGTRDHE